MSILFVVPCAKQKIWGRVPQRGSAPAGDAQTSDWLMVSSYRQVSSGGRPIGESRPPASTRPTSASNDAEEPYPCYGVLS
jgi:hypothetical protein